MLTFNCDQVLKEAKMKKAEILKLKDNRIFLNMLDDETKAQIKKLETLTEMQTGNEWI